MMCPCWTAASLMTSAASAAVWTMQCACAFAALGLGQRTSPHSCRVLECCRHNFSTGNSFVLGSHDEAVRCLEHSEALGLVLSGSWDKTVKVWDPRAESPLTSTVALPDKCFTLAMTRQRCDAAV